MIQTKRKRNKNTKKNKVSECTNSFRNKSGIRCSRRVSIPCLVRNMQYIITSPNGAWKLYTMWLSNTLSLVGQYGEKWFKVDGDQVLQEMCCSYDKATQSTFVIRKTVPLYMARCPKQSKFTIFLIICFFFNRISKYFSKRFHIILNSLWVFREIMTMFFFQMKYSS